MSLVRTNFLLPAPKKKVKVEFLMKEAVKSSKKPTFIYKGQDSHINYKIFDYGLESDLLSQKSIQLIGDGSHLDRRLTVKFD